MRQIRIRKPHVRIDNPELAILRTELTSRGHTLTALARLGSYTRPGDVEVHDGASDP